MAEAEDVIVDAARHLTAWAMARRRREPAAEPALVDVAPRLDLLLAAVHGRAWTLRTAQPPAPPTMLRRLLRRAPAVAHALPATDGRTIWLPQRLPGLGQEAAATLWRAMALQQAARAALRDREALAALSPLARDVALVLEAEAADALLLRSLPGLAPALAALRAAALATRPAVGRLAPGRQAAEQWLRERLASPIARVLPPLPLAGEGWGEGVALRGAAATRAGAPGPPPALTPTLSRERQREPDSETPSSSASARAAAAAALVAGWPDARPAEPLAKDWWTGDWPPADAVASERPGEAGDPSPDDDRPVRSARLARRPKVREAGPGEDDESPGAFMVQSAQPHESAEDPLGSQRPADRDSDEAAESHAESLSELPEARLVRSRQRAHEVLLADEAPPTTAAPAPPPAAAANGTAFAYPEWDWRRQTWRDPGATVWERPAPPGDADWVRRTLEARRATHDAVRRRFEMLRARRVVLPRQPDGDEPDLDACVEALADLRAGAALPERLYRQTRLARRDTAVVVLVDASGSTDSWVGGSRRIVDVEREALLTLSVAVDAAGDPFSLLAFSGEGPQGVVVQVLKRFDEHAGDAVAARIAGLEPDRYTRAGAAIRHAASRLAAQPAEHRLLLLLSDGRPNDCDEYEGRYGVEDMRQAVVEARLAGQHPFCLTVDRQAAAWLPRVFGPGQHALLRDAERLPEVLLGWMRRLLTH